MVQVDGPSRWSNLLKHFLGHSKDRHRFEAGTARGDRDSGATSWLARRPRAMRTPQDPTFLGLAPSPPALLAPLLEPPPPPPSDHRRSRPRCRGHRVNQNDDIARSLRLAGSGAAATCRRCCSIYGRARDQSCSGCQLILGQKLLQDNLAGLDVRLDATHAAKLDALSKPTLSFPADFIANGAQFVRGGTTINGRAAETWPLSPKDDRERY